MDYRTYKKTGQQISLLGLGVMRMPVVDGNPANIDFDRAAAIVDAALKGGVNYVDTAFNYHGDTAEEFAGRALAAYPRDSYSLATKLPLWLFKTADEIKAFLPAQLKRLQTDHIDFYLLHAMDEERWEHFQKLGVWDWLDAQRKAGVIRNLGFSFHDSPEVLETIAAAHDWDFAQLEINYIDWEFQRAREQYEILEKHNIPCIVMEPVRGGRLANLGPAANQLLQDHNPAASIASWAMRYVAALPNVLTVLSGMSTLDQVRDNLKTFDQFKPLSATEAEVLARAAEVFKSYATLPCTACRYCMPCPSGVDIPGLMAFYNECAFDSSTYRLKDMYEDFPQEHNAAHCTQCGQCEPKCPQHIPIIQSLQKINADATS